MKTNFLIASLAILAATFDASAQKSFQLPAVLIEEEGGYSQVWVTAATKTAFRYKTTEVSTAFEDRKFSQVASLFFPRPALFSSALEQFEARKYEEAKASFAKIKDFCKPILPAPGNPGTLAAFYEMECMRRLGDLDGLSTALQDFVKDPLLDDTHLRQVELFVLWDAVRTKSWDRLAILVNERAETRLAPAHRAQVAYCGGLAAENLGKLDEALLSYSTAMTADAGNSVYSARQAALRILAIHSASEQVQRAISNWGTENENKNSKGYGDLTEAAAVAELFQESLGGGMPLPDEFKELLKYRVKEETPDEA